MTLFIYDAESVENGESENILIDSIEGDDNEDCEKQASLKYGDSDYFCWSYCDR